MPGPRGRLVFCVLAALAAGGEWSRGEHLSLSPPDQSLPTIDLDAGQPGEAATLTHLPVRWLLRASRQPFHGDLTFRYLLERDGGGGATEGGLSVGAAVDVAPGGSASGIVQVPSWARQNTGSAGPGELRPWLRVSLHDEAGEERFSSLHPLSLHLISRTAPLWLRVSEKAGLSPAGRTIEALPLQGPYESAPTEGRTHHIVEVSPEGLEADLVPYDDRAVVTITFTAWQRLEPRQRQRLLRRSPHAPLWILGPPPPGEPIEPDLAACLPVVFGPGPGRIHLPSIAGEERWVETPWRWASRDDRVRTSGGGMPWHASVGPITFHAWDPFELDAEALPVALDHLWNLVDRWRSPAHGIDLMAASGGRLSRGPRFHLKHVALLASICALPIGFAIFGRRAAASPMLIVTACALCSGAILVARETQPDTTPSTAVRMDRTVPFLDLDYERRASWCTDWGCTAFLPLDPDEPGIPTPFAPDAVGGAPILHDEPTQRLVRTQGGWRLSGWAPPSGLFLRKARLSPSGRGDEPEAVRPAGKGALAIDTTHSPGGGRALIRVQSAPYSSRITLVDVRPGARLRELRAADLDLRPWDGWPESASGEYFAAPELLGRGDAAASSDAWIYWQPAASPADEFVYVVKGFMTGEAGLERFDTLLTPGPATRVTWLLGREAARVGKSLVLTVIDRASRGERAVPIVVRGCAGSTDAMGSMVTRPEGPDRRGWDAVIAAGEARRAFLEVPIEATERACAGGGWYEVEVPTPSIEPGMLVGSYGSVAR